jgi:hypothetical protein
MRKIDIYRNGIYLCSTNKAKTCKEACQNIRDAVVKGFVEIGGQGKVAIRASDTLRAWFDKR